MSPKTIAGYYKLIHSSNACGYSALTQDEEKAQFSNLTSLSSEDGSSKPDSPIPAQSPPTHTKFRSTFSKFLSGKVPWIFSTMLLLCTTLAMSAKNGGVYERYGTFETGFNTDFSKMKSAIRLQNVNFTGTTKFAEDGTPYIDPQPSQNQYVGQPNEQIDHNWNQLTRNRYFRLTEEEAEAAWGDEYPEFWDAQENGGGYTVGLDVFHTLHCLDHIRQKFYPDYYPQTSIHGQKHHEHCINHLRQMVMCYADATPIPTRFFKGIGHNYVDGDRMHTCRDFGAIRKWTSERFESDGLHDFDDHHGA